MCVWELRYARQWRGILCFFSFISFQCEFCAMLVQMQFVNLWICSPFSECVHLAFVVSMGLRIADQPLKKCTINCVCRSVGRPAVLTRFLKSSKTVPIRSDCATKMRWMHQLPMWFSVAFFGFFFFSLLPQQGPSNRNYYWMESKKQAFPDAHVTPPRSA